MHTCSKHVVQVSVAQSPIANMPNFVILCSHVLYQESSIGTITTHLKPCAVIELLTPESESY